MLASPGTSHQLATEPSRPCRYRPICFKLLPWPSLGTPRRPAYTADEFHSAFLWAPCKKHLSSFLYHSKSQVTALVLHRGIQVCLQVKLRPGHLFGDAVLLQTTHVQRLVVVLHDEFPQATSDILPASLGPSRRSGCHCSKCRSDFHGTGPESFGGTWVVRCVHREHTVRFTLNALATAWCTTPVALLPLFFCPCRRGAATPTRRHPRWTRSGCNRRIS